MISTRKKNKTLDVLPCHWRTRMAQADCVDIRSHVTAGTQWWVNRASGCDCAARFSWYLSPWPEYQRYLLWQSFLTCAELKDRAAEMETWDYHPLISILLPVYKVALPHLAECLVSVEQQVYPHWELCLVEDGSGSEEIRNMLRAFSAKHPDRVRLVLRDRNLGIARTSQEALEMATGEFVALLDHDDRLAPEALEEMVHRLQFERDADWLYSDYDKISPDGERYHYYFKPDWSPDLLYSYCYVGHLSLLRRSLALSVGGFRTGFEGAQDFDLYLRMAERAQRVVHVSRILYSWRQAPGSTAGDLASKPYLYENLRRAMDDAIRRRGEPGTCAEITGFWAGLYRVNRSTVTPVCDVVDLSRSAIGTDTANPGGKCRVGRRFVLADGENCGATLQRALTETTAPCLVVVQGDRVFVSNAAMHDLAAHLSVPGVAGAAPKIVGSDGHVDHCGLALVPGGKILFPLRGLGSGEAGYGAYGTVARNVGAVSPLVVAFSVAAVREAGGFDPRMGATGAVTAACLTLRTKGFRIVADGGVTVELAGGLFCAEQAMAAGGEDFRRLVTAWPSLCCAGDPFYNRNLREEPADFGVRDGRDF